MGEKENKFLNKIKTNIISWYSFKENASILIIGEDVKEYSDYLIKKGKNVILEKDNLSENSIDYVVIFDKVNRIYDIKKYLKPDGIILLIANNRLGIKNLSVLENFENLVNNSLAEYSRKQIENILKENGYENYKFYYPLPNYKTANVIFSDDYLPEYNNTKLMNNYYYPEETKLLFKETELLKEVTRCGEFTSFTNSYFVEINNKSEEKFIGFNNTRKEEYRLITKICDEYVVKEEVSVESKKHIENMQRNLEILDRCQIKSLDSYKDAKIYSKYVSDKTLYQVLIDYIFENKTEEAKQLIREFYEFLKQRLETEKTEEVNTSIFENIENVKELTFIKNGLIDLVFENVFKIDGEYITFDQEWNIENIPLEFILYRSINNVYIYSGEIQKYLPREDLYKEFGFEKYIEDFKIAEKNIQAKIVDLDKIRIYESSEKTSYIEILENELKSVKEENTYISSENEQLKNNLKEKDKNIEDHKNHIGRLEDALKEKDSVIENLNETIKQKQMTIDYYENMRVVKIMNKIKK